MSLVALGALTLMLSSAAPAEAGGPKYKIDTSKTTTELKAGKDGTFALHIQPAKGFKVSPDAPLKIKLASPGLELNKKTLGHKDATEKKAKAPQFAVKFASKTAGTQKIDVNASFYVCDVKMCERKQEKITVAVNVKP